MSHDLLTPAQAAELFGVHATTVSEWANQGRIKGTKTLGGHWRFHRADLEEAMSSEFVTTRVVDREKP